MTARRPTQQFILLPHRGLRASEPASARFLASLRGPRIAPASRGPATVEVEGATLRVLDSISEDGAKLVEISAADVHLLRGSQPSIRLVPLVYYRPALAPRFAVKGPAKLAAGRAPTRVVLKVVSKADGAPVHTDDPATTPAGE